MLDLGFLVFTAAKLGLVLVEVIFERLFAAGACFFCGFLPDAHECADACDVADVPELVDVASSSLAPIITSETWDS